MFKEIAPCLLKGGITLSLVISREDDQHLRVTVIAKESKTAGDAKESALSKPATVIDTPEQLDQTLGLALAEYQGARAEATSTLGELTESLKQEAATNRKKTRQPQAKTTESTAQLTIPMGATQTAAAKDERLGTTSPAEPATTETTKP